MSTSVTCLLFQLSLLSEKHAVFSLASCFGDAYGWCSQAAAERVAHIPLYFCSSFYPQLSTSGKGQGFKWKLQICFTLCWNATGSWSGGWTPDRQFNLQSSFARETNIWTHWLVWNLLGAERDPCYQLRRVWGYLGCADVKDWGCAKVIAFLPDSFSFISVFQHLYH